MEQVYGYGRVSKEDKDDPERSLKNQEDDERRWCQENNYEFIDYRFDKNITGTSVNRPSINYYKDLAVKEDFKLIITRSDRLGRGRALLELIDYFEINHNVQIISIANDLADELQRETMAFASGLYAIIGRLNIRRLRERKAKDGLPYFQAPFAYKYNKKKEWVVDEEKAKIVERVYQMILGDSGWKIICDKFKLNPKQYYKIIHDKNYTGKVWHKHYIIEPLTKKIIRTEEVEYDGKHEVIISRDIFYKVQEKLKKKKVAKYLL